MKVRVEIVYGERALWRGELKFPVVPNVGDQIYFNHNIPGIYDEIGIVTIRRFYSDGSPTWLEVSLDDTFRGDDVLIGG